MKTSAALPEVALLKNDREKRGEKAVEKGSAAEAVVCKN
jgi:hypothetical protein